MCGVRTAGVSLCLKSGNAVILKVGSEAKHTNRALFDVIHEAGVNAGLPERFASIVEDRAAITELLACDEDIDLIITDAGVSPNVVNLINDHGINLIIAK